MLRDIVKLTQLDPKFCAGLFGVAPEQFYEWMAETRPIPKFLLPELASVFGVPPADVTEHRARPDGEFVPAIWYKLRTQERSSAADLQIVGLIRKLCFNFCELQALLQVENVCDAVFQKVRSQINQSAPIGAQAREAAEFVRAEFHWHHGSGGTAGIGDLIRPHLRKAGLVIVESPVPDSQIEGCSFRVRADHDIACVFANSYQSTWFRRNNVILHEVCHSIFDLEGDPVSIDYQSETSDELKERRAALFAQDCLLPKSVLVHVTNQLGVKWEALTPEMLARLVAECHAEQRLILRVALASRFVTADQYDHYLSFECTSLIKQFSSHALTTREFLASVPKKDHRWFFQDRLVKIGERAILLPVGYVKAIIDLLASDSITVAKAAELTMMDHYAFQERFGSMIHKAA